MTQVVLIENIEEPASWERLDVLDLCALLVERFGEKFPDTGRIYHGEVSQDNDVTPGDEGGITRLQEMPGPFFVVLYPGDPITLLVVGLSIGLGVAAALLLAPPPIDALRNTQSSSPNNSLSDRSNKARLGGRIPDIFGTVRSTPDLLTPPFTFFKNNVEVEVAYMCVGRGAYDITDIRDDTTLLADVDGASVEVYGPGTSPNSGSPELTIGDPITQPLITAKRNNSVNGQVLFAPNYRTVIGTVNIKFYLSGRFESTNKFDFTDYFEAGDFVTISNTIAVSGGHTANLNGTYQVYSVSTIRLFGNKVSTVRLVDPGAVNAGWHQLDFFPSDRGAVSAPRIALAVDYWVGPFIMDVSDATTFAFNFVAPRGLYKTDGQHQESSDVTVQMGITPVDDAGIATGGEQYFNATVFGSGVTTNQRAVTYIAAPTFSGQCKVRVRRTSNLDVDFDGTVVEEVKWRDVYALTPVTASEFGDVTTVYSQTFATEGALAVKDRKLNMLVTRMIPYNDGSGPTVTLYPTNDAGQILIAAALDPYIGRRSSSEVDAAQIAATMTAVRSYFGIDEASEFSYTFDNNNISFEETANIIAAAVFCRAYRRGSALKLFFERATDDSSILFNHRNKTPGSELRTVSFGRASDFDGVAYDYVDPEDDAVVTLYVPQGEASAIKPYKVESLGVRNLFQATLAAWREWYKLKYRNTVTEFEATQEADLVIPSERVLVADNTRSNTSDGEVMAQNALELTLSQPFDPAGALDHFIFLQLYDGTIQVIEIASVDGGDAHKITLAEAPSLALVLDEDQYARTTYMIQGPTPTSRSAAFLVSEKDPRGNFLVGMKAVNYDTRYYGHDQLYGTGEIIDPGGGGSVHITATMSAALPVPFTSADVTTGDPETEGDGTVLYDSAGACGDLSYTPTLDCEADVFLWGDGGTGGTGTPGTPGDKGEDEKDPDDDTPPTDPTYGGGGGGGGLAVKRVSLLSGVAFEFSIGCGAEVAVDGQGSEITSEGMTANGGTAGGDGTAGVGGTATGGDSNYTGHDGSLSTPTSGGGARDVDGVYTDQTTDGATGTYPGGGGAGDGGGGNKGRVLILFRGLTGGVIEGGAETGDLSATLAVPTLGATATVSAGGAESGDLGAALAVPTISATATFTAGEGGDPVDGDVIYDSGDTSAWGDQSFTPDFSCAVDAYLWGDGGTGGTGTPGYPGDKGEDEKDPGDDTPPSDPTYGGGGAGGGLCIKRINITSGVALTFHIGGGALVGVDGQGSAVSSASMVANGGTAGGDGSDGTGGTATGGDLNYTGHNGGTVSTGNGGGARQLDTSYNDQTAGSSDGLFPGGGGSADGGGGQIGRLLLVYRGPATGGTITATMSATLAVPSTSTDVDVEAGGDVTAVMTATLDVPSTSTDVDVEDGAPSHTDGDILYDSDGEYGDVSYTPDYSGFADIYLWGDGGTGGVTDPGYPGDKGEDEKDPGDDNPPIDPTPGGGGGGGALCKKHVSLTSGIAFEANLGGGSAVAVDGQGSTADSGMSAGGGTAGGTGSDGSGGTASGGDNNYTGHSGSSVTTGSGGGARQIDTTYNDQTSGSSAGHFPGGGGSADSGGGAKGRLLIIYRSS